MSFSINTNLASLQAQNYLQKSSMFQSQTINQVTSGLRIVNSGDDAAGLAVANGLRSDQAVLNQGIQNGNNGLATLQTVDSGMNNISTLLDRARTLATESASGTFTGDRSTLNGEFQSVISEINRQAQSIGMNQGGSFAKDLSVFIGGGKGNTSAAASTNGSIDLNLSKSSVDAQSLGLSGMQASGAAGTDIGANSATSVSNILANSANTHLQAGSTTFYLSGAGFSGANRMAINVNLAGVTDANSLVTAVNGAIQAAGNGGSQYATALKNANVTASLVTDSQGKQQLSFSSSVTAFQAQAGDTTANALMGNFAQNATMTGNTVANGTVAFGSSPALSIKFDGDSSATSISLSASDSNLAQVVQDLNSNTSFSARATASVSGNQLVLQSKNNTSTSALTVNDGGVGSASRLLGLTTSATAATASAGNATTGASVTTTVTGANAVSSSIPAGDTDSIKLRFQGAGLASPVDISLNQLGSGGSATVAAALADITSKVAGNSQLAAAGITLSQASAGSQLQFTSTSGQTFTVEASGDTQNVLGLGSFLTDTNKDVEYSSATASSTYSTSSTSNGTVSLGVSIGGAAQQTVSAQMTSNAKLVSGTNSGNVTYTPVSGGLANTLAIKVDGGSDVNVTLASGTSLTTMAGAINTALITAGSNASASVVNNQLVLTSATKGTGSMQIDTAGSDANLVSALGLNGTAVTATTTDATGAKATGTVSFTGNVDMTANSATGAFDIQLDGASGRKFHVSGLTSATTSGATAVAAINGVLGNAGTASLDNSGHIQITSNITGSNSGVVISGNAGTLQDLGFTTPTTANGANASETNVIGQLNNAIAQNSTLAAAGLSASDSSGSIKLSSSNGTNFRMNSTGTGDAGFGIAGAAFTGNFSSLAPSNSATPFSNSQGATGTQNLGFKAMTYGNDNQTLTFSSDNSGVSQQTSITLSNTNARSLDEAINTINSKLQQTNNPTLQSIVAVKQDLGNGAEGISFESSLHNFSVSVGQTNSGNGVNIPGTNGAAATQGTAVVAAQQGNGGTADISTMAGAQAAVTTLATAVQNLGTAQAAVGKGENLLNYAISLATSQTTNEAAAESQIRDANLAQEAANLSRAQILVQAGTAALAQANSAPQQLLSLLKG